MSTFIPYADDSSRSEIAGFTLENHLDRVAMYGQTDFSRDQVGLARAKALQALLNEIVDNLSAQADLPAQIERDTVEVVDNPFI